MKKSSPIASKWVRNPKTLQTVFPKDIFRSGREGLSGGKRYLPGMTDVLF